MKLNPQLAFNGQCEEAFRFYERALGGRIVHQSRYADTPMASQVSEEWRNKIIHASLEIGDQTVYGCDPPPDRYRRPEGFDMAIDTADAAEADRIFAALSENATITMPVQETFWALRFGMFTDQFGIPWMINCGKAM